MTSRGDAPFDFLPRSVQSRFPHRGHHLGSRLLRGTQLCPHLGQVSLGSSAMLCLLAIVTDFLTRHDVGDIPKVAPPIFMLVERLITPRTLFDLNLRCHPRPSSCLLPIPYTPRQGLSTPLRIWQKDFLRTLVSAKTAHNLLTSP